MGKPSMGIAPIAYIDNREIMVKRQLLGRGFNDERVLRAMRKVPRHLFIPENSRRESYDDHAISIGFGQTISQPYVVAFMSEALNLQHGDRVLEIGTGSGYQTAILAELVREVYTIEIVQELGARTKKLLRDLGYENANFRIGDGHEGWHEKSPFDAVIVTAAPPKVPQTLLNQLKIGGRLVIPVGDTNQDLVLIHRTQNGYERKKMLPVAFVPMTGEPQNKGEPS
jgi:protein-L-isoaspartate(D-aspartate) O-methyltransferase